MKTVEEIYDELKAIYAAKNHDYGNSFEESCNKFGLVAAVVRMNDKINRINTLYAREENAKVNESLTDTLLDLANYAVMTASYISNHSKKENLDKSYFHNSKTF